MHTSAEFWFKEAVERWAFAFRIYICIALSAKMRLE